MHLIKQITLIYNGKRENVNPNDIKDFVSPTTSDIEAYRKKVFELAENRPDDIQFIYDTIE